MIYYTFQRTRSILYDSGNFATLVGGSGHGNIAGRRGRRG